MADSLSDRRLERIGTGVLAVALVIVPLAYGPGFADPFAFVKRALILLAALLAWGLALLPASPDRPSLSTPLRALVLVFLAASAIACGIALNRGLALWGLADLAAGFGVFFATLRFARDARSVALLLRAALAGAALVALGSLVQLFVPATSGTWLSLLPPSRGGSTLGDPGLVSQLLVVALPVGIGAAALSSPGWRQVCGGLIGLVAAALVFVGRPDGWRAALAALVLVLVGRLIQVAGHGGRWPRLAPDLGGAGFRSFLIAGIVVLCAVSASRLTMLGPSKKAIVPLQGTSLLSPTTGNPGADRRAAVSSTWTLIRRHPLGVGPANFRHAFLEVAWSGDGPSPFSLSHQAVHPGNAFIEMAAETGILGGLCFALVVFVLLLQAGLAAARAGAPWDSVGVAGFATVASFGVMAFRGAPFQEPAPALVFFIVAGVVQRALAHAESAPAGRSGLGRRRAALAVVWLAACALAGMAVVERARASGWTLAGQGAYYGGQYGAALQAFRQPPVRRSPEHLPRVLAASSCMRLGQYAQAAREFSEALLRSPYFIAAYLGRAQAEEAQGHWDLADADYRAALRIWPKNADIYLALANLEAVRGRVDDALDDYRRVMQLNPGLADTYFRMGELFLRRKQLDEAIEAFRICGMKNPKYPRMRLRLGDAFFQKGLQEMALRYYQAAAAEDDKDVEARLRIANALHAMGRSCEAKESLEAARDLETDTTRRDSILDLIKKVEPDCRKQGGPQPRSGSSRPPG